MRSMDSKADEMTKPLLVFDGDCSFCRRWITRWRDITADRVNYAPFQEVADQFPSIPREEFASAAWLIDPDRSAHRGARAVFGALAVAPGHAWPLWFYRRVPGVRAMTESVYRFVAGHRPLFSALTTLLWGPTVTRPTFTFTRWLFLRMLGVVYFIAFSSLAVQVAGLIGQAGILPAGEFLDRVRQRLGTAAYWQVPTLAWIDASDTTLQWMCWGGAAASLLLILNVAPGQLLLLLWVLYLSLYHVGQTFLSFQWDILLLETGFLAIFFAPWNLRPRLSSESRPSRTMRCLLVWLLFRLMFSSGVVKLVDDDPVGREWHHLTALAYHYETQCIPNAISWYAHHLPEWCHKVCVVIMFIIEIGVPFLFFFPRRPRILACILQVLLQTTIILTGNYNFFNLLTITLCLVLLDDAFLSRVAPASLKRRFGTPSSRRPMPLIQRLVIPPLAVCIMAVSAIWIHEVFIPYENLLPVEQRILRNVRPYAVVNTYGLFRHMTTRRPEIIVEGSVDGRIWKSYEFKYKPGDLRRRPPFVAPHQPRLDWQMWFAALADYRNPRNGWFIQFSRRLLEGSPDVLALLAHNPFPDRPPRYLRATLYDYHFTNWGEAFRTENWWAREQIGQYLPTITRQSFADQTDRR